MTMAELRSDVLVVFGATGDLAHKMIFPSLYAMVKRGTLTTPIIGVAFDAWSRDQLIARARDAVEKHVDAIDEAVFGRLAAQLDYVSGDYRSRRPSTSCAPPSAATAIRSTTSPSRPRSSRPWSKISMPPALLPRRG